MGTGKPVGGADVAPAPSPRRAPRRRTGRLDDWLLAAVVLLLTVPIMHPLMAQQASRYTLTAALWDDRTVVLDAYADSITVDYAVRDGRLLSDKAPGQPLIAIPAYALYRAVGGEPATLYRPWGNLGLWIVSVWCAAIPAALLAVLMRRRGLRQGWSPPVATMAALGLATATLLLPFATLLFSHVLTALLVYAAWVVVRGGARRPGAARLFIGGTLAAVAVTGEYTAALAGGVVFLAVAYRERLRAVWFLLGGVAPAAVLALYHTITFGGPLTTGYRFSGYADLHAEGFFGVRPPQVGMLAEVLAGDRGLFVLTPLVLVGVLGCVAVLRRGIGPARDDAAVGLAVTALSVLMMAGWSNATGGASPGPRYVVPALPFLVPGVAYAFARWEVAAWSTTIVGWVTMALATFTLPLAPREAPSALAWWWERVGSAELADTLVARYVAPELLFLPPAAAVALGVVLVLRQGPVPLGMGGAPVPTAGGVRAP